MNVELQKRGKSWVIILIPEDEIETSILKLKNGCVATHATDIKSNGSHIADCLIIDSENRDLQP